VTAQRLRLLTLPVEGSAILRTVPLTLDDQFVLIANDIDGFGGIYLDESGILNMYLVDLSEAERAKQLIGTKFSGILGESAASKFGDIRVRKAKYTFPELKDWKDRSGDVLRLPGAVFYDIDESANRLRIGVQGGDPLGSVARRLIAHGIPSEAAVVVDAEAPVPLEKNNRPRAPA
jgi:hypothetical protein